MAARDRARLHYPILQFVQDHGGSATTGEIKAAFIETHVDLMELSYLKSEGLLDNAVRGVWTITALGRADVLLEPIRQLLAQALALPAT
jgi:hypothetical protein